jgi:hypothetical protein
MSKWKEQQEDLKEFKAKLKEDFPLLYERLGLPSRDGGMISCNFGNGWFDIIWGLSGRIEAILKDMSEDERPVALQVKEKFGTLRFYMAYKEDGEWNFTREIPELFDTIINQATKLSSITCEWCGQPGTSDCDYKRYWIKTLCPDCHEENENEIKSRMV